MSNCEDCFKMHGSILLHSIKPNQPIKYRELASKTGLTISEVEKTCEWLIKIGVPLVQLPSGRVQLLRTIAPLNADQIRGAVSMIDAEMSRQIELFEQIDSTNQYLMNVSQTELRHKQVCIAEHMSSGRGRQQRPWYGGAYENVMLSVAWKFGRDIQALSGLSLAVAVVIVQCLSRIYDAQFQLKWPNDVLVGGRKLSGILVETRDSAAVIGIGINCNLSTALQLEIQKPVVSLSEITHGAVDRNRLIPLLLGELKDGLEVFSRSGLLPFREEWMRLHAYQGKRVRTEGTLEREGMALGIDHTGALIIRLDSGDSVSINSGEVSVVPENLS